MWFGGIFWWRGIGEGNAERTPAKLAVVVGQQRSVAGRRMQLPPPPNMFAEQPLLVANSPLVMFRLCFTLPPGIYNQPRNLDRD
jgi:hypothetical protein